MDLTPFKDLIKEKSKKYEAFGQSALLKSLAFAFIIIGSLFFGIHYYGWLGFFVGIFISIFSYLALGMYGVSTKVEAIEREVKRDVIIPLFKQVFPGMTYNPDGFHTYEQVKSASFFTNWLKKRHLKGEDLIECNLGQYQIKLSEIIVSGISTRYPLILLSVNFDNIKFKNNLLIKSIQLYFKEGSKKGSDYRLYFKSSLEHYIQIDNKGFNQTYYQSSDQKSELTDFHQKIIPEFIDSISKATLKVNPLKGTRQFLSFQDNQMNILLMNLSLFNYDYSDSMDQKNIVEKYYSFASTLKASLDKMLRAKPHQ